MGLYLNPPEQALVLCANEKTSVHESQVTIVAQQDDWSPKKSRSGGINPAVVAYRLVIRTRNIDLSRPDRSKHPTPNALVGEIAKPTFDPVKPRTGSRHKMQMESGMAFEPRFDLGMLMSRVIVQDQSCRCVCSRGSWFHIVP